MLYPCLAEERYCASGTVWRGLYDGLGCPECVQCMPKTAQVIAKTAGWLHARTAMLQIPWLERSMEGADAAPRFLEGLLEAMLQSVYDRFGGLSKLTKGWTGVYMADGGGRMHTRTAMLEISWLPRSLEGADASFWPANVRVFISPGLRASFCFWVRGLHLVSIYLNSWTCKHDSIQISMSLRGVNPYQATCGEVQRLNNALDVANRSCKHAEAILHVSGFEQIELMSALVVAISFLGLIEGLFRPFFKPHGP